MKGWDDNEYLAALSLSSLDSEDSDHENILENEIKHQDNMQNTRNLSGSSQNKSSESAQRLQRLLNVEESPGSDDDDASMNGEAREIYDRLSRIDVMVNDSKGHAHEHRSSHSHTTIEDENYPTTPIDLAPHTPCFASIEKIARGVDFRFEVSHDLTAREVVAFTVFCVPNYAIDDEFVSAVQKKRVAGLDFLPLHFHIDYGGNAGSSSLVRSQNNSKNNTMNSMLSQSAASQLAHSGASSKQNSSTIFLKAMLFNGTYTFVLTTTHGSLRAGQYVLRISCVDDEVDDDAHDVEAARSTGGSPSRSFKEKSSSFLFRQDVRVEFRVENVVKAGSISPGSGMLKKSVGYQDMVYYRVVLTDRSQMLTVQVISDEGDVDLFISNRFDGMVAVTAETAVWSNYDLGISTIQICPGDIHLSDEAHSR